jgi:hypothetical protein
VRAYYCSSDLWLGESTERQATTGSPEGWYFSGRTNFRAALEVLIAHHGLDEAHPDSRLLLVGYSAGGAGVVGNLDTVLELLPTMAAEHRVKVVLDGSWIAPADPALLPDADRWGPAHKACASELEAQGIDPVQCIFGPRWWPHAAATGLDFLVQISGMDVTQTPVWKVESKEELLAWSEGVAASLEPLPWVFSRGRPYHTLTFDDAFALPSPKGTYGAVLRRFWEGAPPEQVLFDYGL